MKARTEAEIKAYADGYKACYKEFCQCLKKHTADQAIKQMGMFVVVVSNCVEVAEQTEPSCDSCARKGEEGCEQPCLGCGDCGLYEAKTQTETQNSNLTFEKRTMLDCYNCKRFETEDECIECRYEPKDEPQTDCAWK